MSAPPQPPLKRLLSIIEPDRGDLIAVVVFALVMGGLLLATPVAVQTLVNFVAFGSSIPPLLVLSFLLFVGPCGGRHGCGRSDLDRRAFPAPESLCGSSLILAADFLGSPGRPPTSTYTPELVNRFFDVMTVQKACSVLLLEGLGNLLGIVVGLTVLAFYHPLLLAFDLVLLVAVSLVVFAPMRRGVQSAISESKAKYAVAGWLEDLARSPLTFRAADSSAYVDQRSEGLARQYVDLRRRHYRVVFGQILGTLGLQVIASTALLAIGGFLVIRGELTLGQLVAAELIVTVVVQSVSKLGKHLETYYDLMAAVDKIGVLFDLEVEESRESSIERGVDTSTRGATLELRDISLASEPDRFLIEGLNVRLESGQTLAIRGRSGSGRSTLLELLYGMRTPDRGEIILDQLEYREIDLNRLRSEVSIAASVEIFEGTVADNLTLGRKNIGVHELTEALRAIDLLESLRALPGGLQTRLHPGGLPLSEGQRLRLVLARALLAKPRLLLVDGLLDSMSDEGRAAARELLFRENCPWSLVLVTNREDLIAACDSWIDLSAPSEQLGSEPCPA